ncbi:MAG TPA: hypothetical protein VIJ23_11285 [Mycobacterium sp.]
MRPPVLELVTAVLFALTTARFGVSWPLPAYLTFAAAAVLLAVVDLQHRRLPNVLVGPFAVVALGLLTLASWGLGEWQPLLRARSTGRVTGCPVGPARCSGRRACDQCDWH